MTKPNTGRAQRREKPVVKDMSPRNGETVRAGRNDKTETTLNTGGVNPIIIARDRALGNG